MVTTFPKIFKEMTQLEFYLHGVLQKLIDLAEQTFYFQTIGDFVIQDVHSMMVMEKYLPQIFPQLAKSVNLINPNMKILNLLPFRQKSCKNYFLLYLSSEVLNIKKVTKLTNVHSDYFHIYSLTNIPWDSQ